MKEALRSLLDNLDQVSSEHGEVTDTDVREQMHGAIYQGFVVLSPDYSLPQEFGMFSDEGNSQVREALLQFLHHPEVVAAQTQLQTPEERLAAFQDNEVFSAAGMGYDEYFGYREGL